MEHFSDNIFLMLSRDRFLKEALVVIVVAVILRITRGKIAIRLLEERDEMVFSQFYLLRAL